MQILLCIINFSSLVLYLFFFFKQKTAYEMRISDWSSDVCSSDLYYISLAIKIMIYSIFALSLQLLVGGAGLVSLGHAAFFGIAAYTTTLLSPESGPGNLLWLVPAAMLCALAYALLTGALALRTRGVYFIMVTLAFSQMAYYVFHDTDVGGGSDGIYLYFRPDLRLGDSVLINIESP